MVTATVALEQWDAVPLKMLLRVTGPDGTVRHAQIAVASNTQTVGVRIDNPQLWWPNGYGEQPLYEVKVEVKDKNSASTLGVVKKQVPELARSETGQSGKVFFDRP